MSTSYTTGVLYSPRGRRFGPDILTSNHVLTPVTFPHFRNPEDILYGLYNLYLEHVVAPRRLVRCIYTLPGTGQFYHSVSPC